MARERRLDVARRPEVRAARRTKLAGASALSLRCLVRLKHNNHTGLAEVWAKLLTFAQDPGNDDEGAECTLDT